MPTAVIAFAFDPVIRLAGVAVRLETVFLAGAILVGLVVAAWLAGRDRGDGSAGGLRRDDLLFIVLGAGASAAAGGRIGYALLHVDYYAANPGALLDPAAGSMELSLAVVGGTIGGALIAQLVDGSVGRWLHVATIPTLVVLGLGKIATALGGGGQGQPADVPWSTAYLGPGPWRSLAPEVASHPAQLYEAAATFVVLAIVVVLLAGGRFRERDGRAFLVAVALWALARVIVASTWRDAPVAGPLVAGQLVACVVALAAGGLAWALPDSAGRDRRVASAAPSWPDPASRPRF